MNNVVDVPLQVQQVLGEEVLRQWTNHRVLAFTSHSLALSRSPGVYGAGPPEWPQRALTCIPQALTDGHATTEGARKVADPVAGVVDPNSPDSKQCVM